MPGLSLGGSEGINQFQKEILCPENDSKQSLTLPLSSGTSPTIKGPWEPLTLSPFSITFLHMALDPPTPPFLPLGSIGKD